jgi:hypothetical protein
MKFEVVQHSNMQEPVVLERDIEGREAALCAAGRHKAQWEIDENGGRPSQATTFYYRRQE